MRSTGISLSAGGSITFGDSTTQTTAGLTDAPSDGSTYGRQNGAWVDAGGGGATPGEYANAYSIEENGQTVIGTGNVITVSDLAPDAGSSWIWLAELTMTGANGSEATIFNGTYESLFIPGCNQAIPAQGVSKVIYSPSFAIIEDSMFDKVLLGSSVTGPSQGALLRHADNIIGTGVFATNSAEVMCNNYTEIHAGQPDGSGLFITYTTFPYNGENITSGGPYPAPEGEEGPRHYYVSAGGNGGYTVETTYD
jgi:hypothetical protein